MTSKAFGWSKEEDEDPNYRVRKTKQKRIQRGPAMRRHSVFTICLLQLYNSITALYSSSFWSEPWLFLAERVLHTRARCGGGDVAQHLLE